MIAKLHAPVVLVHGLLGFDHVRVANLTLASYFPNIPETLEQAGNRVFVPALSPTGSIAQRAAQLKDYLDRVSPQEPVHLIAHSMGGLDARYLISKLGMAERVRSLTTLGTPHRGSPFADWAITKVERLVKPVLTFFGVPIHAFYDLTCSACRKFNDDVPAAPGVRYFSVAGTHDGGYANPGWLLSYNVVFKAEGPNDGVVSHVSARYGELIEIWDGDHFALVNWVNPMGLPRNGNRALALYARIVKRLKDSGF
jgi:triacylglycerol lipase